MRMTLALFILLTLPSPAVASDPYTDGTIPLCSPNTFAEAIREYSMRLNDAAKKKLVVALGLLDAWYNINAKGAGLKMTESDTKEFLAKAVCGRSGYQVEQIAAKMMGTK